MKKNIKNLILVSVLFLGIFFLTGCTKKIDSKLIGTWEYAEEESEGVLKSVYVFKKDGTGSQTITVDDASSTNNYTYETKDGKIFITYEGDTDVFELGYRFSDNDLVLKDSFDEEFTCIKK